MEQVQQITSKEGECIQTPLPPKKLAKSLTKLSLLLALPDGKTENQRVEKYSEETPKENPLLMFFTGAVELK